MATIIGGNNGPGTLDSSLYLLNQNLTTGAGTAGNNEQLYINVSNGNLVIEHVDQFLPSETNLFLMLRTYNSQGNLWGVLGNDGFTMTQSLNLAQITGNIIVLQNPDGTNYTFSYNSTTGLYVTTNGAGAYETIAYQKSTGDYLLTQSDQTVLTFSKNGMLLQSKDTNGNTVTYAYQGSTLVSMSDNDGHKLTFNYSGGFLASIVDETGVVFAKYTYAGNRLTSVTDRAGEVTTYSYFVNGTLASITLPGTTGEPTRTLKFTYNSSPTPGLASFTDAAGNTWTFSYHFNSSNQGHYLGGTTTVTDPLGRVTTYTYNSNGYITDVKDASGNDTVYTYDANENLTSQMSADGSAIVKSDSAYYRSLRQSLGVVETSTGLGKLVAELTTTDIAKLQAYFTTTYTYDGNGNLLSQRDGLGNLTTYTYTSFNKVASTTSPDGYALVSSDAAVYQAKRIELGYAALAESLTAAQKQALLALYTTSYSYDSHQNVIQITAPGGDLTRYTYNAFGNVTTKTVFLNSSNLTNPALQEVTQYSYDAYGNNVKTIDAQGNTTYATFDHFGNRTSATDGNGNVTTYTYDGEGDLTSVKDALGNTTVFTYDAVGNRIGVTDASGHSITYVYNADNLLVSTINPAANGVAGNNRTVSYTYDVVGNRTSSTDANGNTTTYSYDALNRLLNVVTPKVANAAGTMVNYTTSFAYDAVGNRISATDNNGNVTSNVYNSDNLITQTTDATGHITQILYDGDLNEVSIVLGAELAPAAREILKLDYDQRDRLISQTDALGNVRRYSYDGANNRLSVIDENGNTTTYTYDKNNRLLVETRPLGYTVKYQYDASGNQVAITDEDGHTTTTVFDKDNRAVLVTDANGINTVYTYDSRGNRTSVEVGVQVTVTGGNTVTVTGSANAQIESYQYDEFNEVIAVTDGVGNALVTSDLPIYVQIRAQYGITGLAASLSAAQKATLEAAYTEHYVYDRNGNLTARTDHLGRTTSHAYDALNRQVQVTDALGDVSRLAFDGDGNVVKRTDALGHVTTYAYDGLGRLTATTDPLGVATARTYDSFSNLASVTFGSGTTAARTTSYVYDLDNRLVSGTDATGATHTYSYDAVGNRLKVTDALGNVTQYVYDALNRNVEVIDPLGFQTRFVYDGVGNKLQTITPNGGVTSFTYDAGNRQISITDALGNVTQFIYDVRGNRITQTTAVGTSQAETTSYLYDAENHLRQVTDPAGNVTTAGFDSDYNHTSTTDANGHTTSYAYDALNRLVKVTDAAGGVSTYSYDAVGNRLSATDANGHTTTYSYDAKSQLLSSTDPNGIVTAYVYDAVGNRLTITFAAGTAAAATTTFVYDRDNRLISQADGLGNVTTHGYDADGNLTAVTDALGHTTHYAYDGDGRVKTITDALGNTTQYRYDGNGNRVQVIDARGFASTTYYNADNQVVLSVDADGYATKFTYDGNGNLVSETLFATALALPVNPATQPVPIASAGDHTTLYGYDALNRLVQKTDGDGYQTRYVYDAVGNQIQTQQALNLAGTQWEVTRSYFDAANRKIAQLSAQGYLTTYQYDAAGNRSAQTLYNTPVSAPSSGVPQPASGDTGRVTKYTYDAGSRLVSATDADGNTTTYSYDARGNRVSETEAAGTTDARTTSYAYDAADRLITTTNALGFTTHLVLDADGNVLERDEAYGTAQQRVFKFTYDADNRQVSQTDPTGLVTLASYDAAGNVVQKTVAPGVTGQTRVTSYTLDGDGRTIGAIDPTGTRVTYLYDAAGNQLSVTQAVGMPESRSNAFVYDHDNRLVQATDAVGTITTYAYDGAGNKLTATVAAGTAQAATSTYAYDLDNRRISATDPMGGVTSYQYDALGNQTRITDANGGMTVNTFDAVGRSLTSLSAAGVLTVNAYDHRGNLISTTQSFANGTDARTTTYAYDLLNRQVLVTDGDGFSTQITYDAFGNQTSIKRGLYLVPTTSSSYSAAKAAVAIPETNTFTYNADDHLLTYTDAVGNVTSYQYDAVGNRLSTTDGNGHTTSYQYDLLNRLTQISTPAGGVTQYTYDHIGNRTGARTLQSGTPSSGVWATQSFTYDANGRLLTQTDALGVVAAYTYDAVGNQITQTLAAGTADQRVVRMVYDLDNRKIADIDARGNQVSYGYDAVGNRITVTDPLGNTAHYYYDHANQLIELVDPDGAVNTFAYDSAGNQIQSRVYLNTLTGPFSNLTPPTPVASATDRITTSQYDGANLLIAQTKPDGSVTQYSYDAVGNKITEAQYVNTGAPHTLSYAYDADNRLVKFTDVDGTLTTFTYDAANNKLSTTVSNPADPIPVRETEYSYDANNRELSQIFDPSGLDIVQSVTYDKAGDVTSKTDGDGHTSTFTYDLDNRQTTQTDADGNVATFAYDRVGNKVSSTDARGNTTTYVYDAANELIKQILPATQTYTVAGGFQTVNPTTTYVYDADGNQVQVTDANGNVTTRYFDAAGRMTTQVTADGAVTTYAYDAAGDKVSQTLYMQLLTVAAVPGVPPNLSLLGPGRTITYQYDALGRVTLTTYPPAQITTLTNVGTNNPTPVVVTEQVTERSVYDAYGNLVQSFDRNGNATWAWYDAKGRKIAQVDPVGYLTSYAYDDQGNVIRELVYTQPVNTATLSLSTPPAAPAGAVNETDITYDAASRKVEVVAPAIDVFDPTTQTTTTGLRSVTLYSYDKVGNQLTRTLGYGTSQQTTEYAYYDAINRQIAVIDGGRVLSTYAYDANGNITMQKRYFNTVSASVNLGLLNGSTNFAALVSASPTQDEETDNVFDALNRESSTTDVMSGGNLTKSYAYDADGNRTRITDEDGYVTQASFDPMNRLAESVSPDGTGTRYSYDAAGNRIQVYTGIVIGGPPAAASGTAATWSNGSLGLSWATTGTATKPILTWVVYGNSSETVNSISDLGNYGGRTSTQVSSTGAGAASIPAATAGSTVYFRIVTEDTAGNTSWTAEQSLEVPPRFSAVSVSEPSATSLTVTVTFDPGATSPQLLYGAGALTQSAGFVLVSGNTYQATLTGLSNPGALSFALNWQDAAGDTFTSASIPFAAAADQIGTNTSVSQSSFTVGSSTTYAIDVTTQVPASTAQNFISVEAQLYASGSSTQLDETAVTGSNYGLGYYTYSPVLGAVTHLAAGTYTIVLTGVRSDGSTVELDDFSYSVGPSATTLNRTAVSWAAPPAGAGGSQLVVVGGQVASSLRDPATATGASRIVVTDTATGDSTSTDYAAYYGQLFSDTHSVMVASSADSTNNSNYDIAFTANLTANEAANIGGDGNLHLAWGPASGGTSFPNDVALTQSTDTFTTTLISGTDGMGDGLSPGQYDFELYYIDTQGRMVIVEWQRFDAATVNATYSGQSLTVEADETGGTISIDTNGNLALSPGVYSGPVDPARLANVLQVGLRPTGGTSGSQTVTGLQTGYYATDSYNALNYKISSNEGDGLVRNFGVDGNGNEVETDLLGDPSNPNYNPADAITTYAAFDGRNHKIASFGAAVVLSDPFNPVRPVDRYTYDVNNNVTSHTDANGNTFKYVFNALSTQIETIDPYGDTARTLVDQFGNVTGQVDQLGNTTRMVYDLQGRMTSQIDPLGNATTYTYDSFGRKLTQTDPDGNATSFSYDQRDRLTSETDALGNTVTFTYDGRNNRTGSYFPLGEYTQQVYDGLGRVIDTVTNLNGKPEHSQRAYDAFGNLISETDALGRTQTHVYGAFGRLLEDIDQDGNTTGYFYDLYGRRLFTYDATAFPGVTSSSLPPMTDGQTAQDVRTLYDAGGRITEIDDYSTGVSTTYTYDLDGRRLTERVSTPGVTIGGTTNYPVSRNVTYQYDALGEMVSWSDAVTGANLNTEYDADGNVVRESTNAGYDPLNQGGGNPNYMYVDHYYYYDADRRVTEETDATPVDNGTGPYPTIINAYSYDAAGNRTTWQNGSTTVSYTYDQDNRVTGSTFYTGSNLNTQAWSYDAMSNVLTYIVQQGPDANHLSVQSSQTNTYNTENRTVTSVSVSLDSSNNQQTQTTTNTYDDTLRITQTTLQSVSGSNTNNYTYNYSYYGDGREKSVTAFGDASGTSSSIYNADKVQTGVDLGQGDNQDHPAFKRFIADNEGHILFEYHDDGKNSDSIETDQYYYADGNPVGQDQHATDGSHNVYLDSNSADTKNSALDDGSIHFSQLQNLGASAPGANLTYTVHAGDSLQSIASTMYGNPSLWYVIAEANGLSASQQLTAGTQLLIPETIQSGTITAANHQVYSQSQIVGSTLPNLKSPPPPSNGGCATIIAIIAIIVIVVIAVVVSVVTFGAGTAIAAALADAGITGVLAVVATIAATAVVGAVVAVAGNLLQQGILIAIGYQHDFSWKDVGVAAVGGFASGAAAGLGAAAQAGLIAAEFANYVGVADAAINVAGEASKQLIQSGKITSWTSLVAAGIGGFVSGAQAVTKGAAQAAANAAAEEAGTVATQVTQEAVEDATPILTNLGHFAGYLSPWVQLAENYAEGKQIKPEDWAAAAAGTVAAVVSDNDGLTDADAKKFSGVAIRSAEAATINALASGVLALFDPKAGLNFLETSEEQVGAQFIGNSIKVALTSVIPQSPKVGGKSAANGSGQAATGGTIGGLIGAVSETATASDSASDTATETVTETAASPALSQISDTTDAVVADGSGNPTAAEAPTAALGPAASTVESPSNPAADISGTAEQVLGDATALATAGVGIALSDPSNPTRIAAAPVLQSALIDLQVAQATSGSDLSRPYTQEELTSYALLGQAVFTGDIAEVYAAQANVLAAKATAEADAAENQAIAAALSAGSSPAPAPALDTSAVSQSDVGPGAAPTDGESGTDRKQTAEDLNFAHNLMDDGSFAAKAYGAQRLTSTIQLTQTGSFVGVSSEAGSLALSSESTVLQDLGTTVQNVSAPNESLFGLPEFASTEPTVTQTESTVARVAAATSEDAAVVAGEFEQVTTVSTTAARNATLAEVGETAGAAPLGGGITAGINLYKDWGTKSSADLAAGAVWDFVFGTAISAVADTAGTAVGTGATAVTAPVLGPAAPVAGVVLGVGTAGAINYEGDKLYEAYVREPLVSATAPVIQAGIDTYEEVSQQAQESYNTLRQDVSQGYDRLSNEVQQGYTSLQQTAQQDVTAASQTVQQTYANVSQNVQQGYTALSQDVQQGYNAVSQEVQQGYNAVSTSVQQSYNSIKNWWTSH